MREPTGSVRREGGTECARRRVLQALAVLQAGRLCSEARKAASARNANRSAAKG